jgi:hypothetical protein
VTLGLSIGIVEGVGELGGYVTILTGPVMGVDEELVATTFDPVSNDLASLPVAVVIGGAAVRGI